MNTQKEFTDEELYRKDNLERLEAFRPIDDIMFRAMLRDNIPLAEYILRVFLEKPDIEVRKLDVQADMKMVDGARSLVFDAYVTDGNSTKYDLEVQKDTDGADPRRARYHASIMDEKNSHTGEDFLNLTDIYVLFVTETDVVGEGSALNPVERVYTNSGKYFDDGMHILYVNGAYKGGGPVGDLIHDFCCADPDSMKVKMMADAARRVKESTEGVKEMCHSMELLRAESLAQGREEGRQEGRQEGREEGRQEGRILQLIEVYRNELHMDDAMIREKAARKFGLPESEISRYMQEPAEV